MSLLRLLTTGKTLVGLKKPEHRYQLPGQAALPKFGGKKNPFRATVFPDKSETGEIAALGAIPEIAAADAPAAVEVTPTVSQGAAPESIHPTVNPGAAAQVEAHQPGVGRRSPFKALLLWGRAKKANPAKALTGRPLVQGELSLDKVKVVRNDLSETDFEIVPSARAPLGTTMVAPPVGVPTATAPERRCVSAVGKM